MFRGQPRISIHLNQSIRRSDSVLSLNTQAKDLPRKFSTMGPAKLAMTNDNYIPTTNPHPPHNTEELPTCPAVQSIQPSSPH